MNQELALKDMIQGMRTQGWRVVAIWDGHDTTPVHQAETVQHIANMTLAGYPKVSITWTQPRLGIHQPHWELDFSEPAENMLVGLCTRYECFVRDTTATCEDVFGEE